MEQTTKDKETLLRRKLDLLLRTGKLLVESSADTNRIMRNMKRVAAYLGLPAESTHINISYTMLMVNISDEQHSFSKFQRCEKHGINMTAISQVSNFRGEPFARTTRWTVMRRNSRPSVPASATTRPGRWPSVPVLRVADSAFSSVATG